MNLKFWNNNVQQPGTTKDLPNFYKQWTPLTVKNERKLFSYVRKFRREGSDAKSYIRKGFLIYEERRKYLVMDGDPISPIWLCTRSLLNCLIYEENFHFFFNSVQPSVSHRIGVMLHVCLDLDSCVRCQGSHLAQKGGIIVIILLTWCSLGCNDLYINNGTNCSGTLLTPSHLTPFWVRCRLALPLFQPMRNKN